MDNTDPFDSAASDPIALYHAWLNEAKASEINDPNAMSLATCLPGGRPSVRVVLCKRADERGFQFFTNRDGRKGQELTINPQAALCFHWKSLQRQVRAEGTVAEVSETEADEYFASRYRVSQIGAWASQQSRPLDSRETLERRTREFEAKFPDAVPRPPYWTGFIITPTVVEFWQERPYRLHDRIVFTRTGEEWEKQRLFP